MKLLTLLICISAIQLASCKNNNVKTEPENKNNHTQHDTTAVSGYADSINNGLIGADTMKKSVPRVAMQTIGNTHIHIEYSSPGVKGRIIWGGLVPFNTVWVTGAHAATKITFNNAIAINDKKVEAGTYAIFTIPNEKEWIFILNKNYKQHLTDDYSEREDVLRVKVKPQSNAMTQRLTYSIKKLSDQNGSIEIYWEKLKIMVPVNTFSKR